MYECPHCEDVCLDEHGTCYFCGYRSDDFARLTAREAFTPHPISPLPPLSAEDLLSRERRRQENISAHRPAALEALAAERERKDQEARLFDDLVKRYLHLVAGNPTSQPLNVRFIDKKKDWRGRNKRNAAGDVYEIVEQRSMYVIYKYWNDGTDYIYAVDESGAWWHHSINSSKGLVEQKFGGGGDLVWYRKSTRTVVNFGLDFKKVQSALVTSIVAMEKRAAGPSGALQ